MEDNRYYGQNSGQNNRFRRDYQQNPYDRGPPTHRGRGREPYRSSYDNRGPRRPYRDQRYNNSYSRPGPSQQQNNWRDPERTFDDRGREVSDHQRSHQFNDYHNRRPDNEEPSGAAAVPLTPLEEKAKGFLQTVMNQGGVRSKLIFLETVENALQTLQGTVDYCQLQLNVEQNATGEFVLKIDKEQLVKGAFPTKQAAKNALAEQALEILKKDCFYIVKKKGYEEVSTKIKNEVNKEEPQSSFQGSKAHQMMLKMGWGGKGLGVNEQGEEKTVAETIDQNVSRQGLGTDDVFKKIHKLLEDYSKSDKITLLKFDPDFSSEERAHIHKIANKFGLKSKSEGKGEQRRITITKKLHRGDLVYNLLTSSGLENALYELTIPSKFESLWNDEEAPEDDDEEEQDSYHPHFSS